jgi:hypothetical protein
MASSRTAFRTAAGALLLLLQLGCSAAAAGGYGLDAHSSGYGGYGSLSAVGAKPDRAARRVKTPTFKKKVPRAHRLNATAAAPAAAKPALGRRMLQDLTHDRKAAAATTNERSASWPYDAARPWYYTDFSMLNKPASAWSSRPAWAAPTAANVAAQEKAAKNAWTGMWSVLESALDGAAKAIDDAAKAPPAVVDLRIRSPFANVTVNLGGGAEGAYGGYGGYGGYGLAAPAPVGVIEIGQRRTLLAAGEERAVITPRRARDAAAPAAALPGAYGGYGASPAGGYGAAPAAPLSKQAQRKAAKAARLAGRQLLEVVTGGYGGDAAPGGYGGYGAAPQAAPLSKKAQRKAAKAARLAGRQLLEVVTGGYGGDATPGGYGGYGAAAQAAPLSKRAQRKAEKAARRAQKATKA